MANAAPVTHTAVTTNSIGAKALMAAKATVVSPIFGVVALGGIIAFECWKGSKDAEKFVPMAEAE